jgi:hypothetical protein
MEYKVNAPTAGNYNVALRVASAPGGGSLQILSNGTLKATQAITSTGTWQTWSTVNVTVNLPAGNQTLRLNAATGGFNLNWLNVTKLSARPGAATEESNEEQALEATATNMLYPNPAQGVVNLVTDKDSEVYVYTLQGAEVKRLKAVKGENTINLEGLATGVYMVKANDKMYKLIVK